MLRLMFNAHGKQLRTSLLSKSFNCGLIIAVASKGNQPVSDDERQLRRKIFSTQADLQT